MRRPHAILLALMLVPLGCYGGLKDQGMGEGESDSAGTADGDDDDDGDPEDPLDPVDVPTNTVHAPLVPRLTHTQYQNVVLDVLGVALTEEEVDRLPLDIPIEGSYSTAAETQFFNPQYVLGYAHIARSLTDRLSLTELMMTHGGCSSDDAQCRAEFIDGLGLRLYRRPITDEERQQLQDLAEVILEEEGATPEDAAKGIVQAMLQSPQFLYRLEIETDGTPDTVVEVGGYEMASRLSFFLWQSAPDEQLLAFAAGPEGDGRFDAAALPDEVDRMVADPRFDRSRTLFWSDYTLATVASFASVDAETGEELRTSLIESLLRLSGVEAEAQPLSAVFTADELVMTPAVAELAGATPKGTGLEVYSAAETEQRQGIITHPGFLAAMGTTSFVGRGLFMTERLLCQDILPPPGDDDTTTAIEDTAQATEDMTPREASEFRFGLDPVCLSCHTQIEPIAYAFERYDMSGRYTLVDELGRDLYSDGTLPSFQGRPEISFETAPELLSSLAELDQTNACFVENMMEYATGFRAGGAEESIGIASEDFDAQGQTFDALIRAIANNRQLTYKRVVEP